MTGVNTWLLKITKKILCKKTLVRFIYLYIYLNIIFIYLNIYHLLCVHMIFIYSFLYVALWIDDHNGKKQKYSRPEKAIGGALHNIGIQYRDRRTTWSTCKEIRATLWVPCKG